MIYLSKTPAHKNYEQLTTYEDLLTIFGGFRYLGRLDLPESTEVMLTVACIVTPKENQF